MIIRSKTFKQWFSRHFSQDEMRDICEQGVMGRFRFLTDYRDIVKLYNRFENDLWEMLSDDADSFGYDSVSVMIGALTMGKQIDTSYTFKNFVVWYAAEKLARELTHYC
jgi:hypothetical protein